MVSFKRLGEVIGRVVFWVWFVVEPRRNLGISWRQLFLIYVFREMPR